MADQILRTLAAERNRLWAEARLKGLPVDSPQRQRIADIDGQMAELKANAPPAKGKR